MIECKTCAGNTFSFSKFTQYDRLKKYMGLQGIIAGVVIYYYDLKKVLFVPIQTAVQMKADGKKSINGKDMGEYNHIEFDSIPLRTFMKTDYRKILDL